MSVSGAPPRPGGRDATRAGGERRSWREKGRLGTPGSQGGRPPRSLCPRRGPCPPPRSAAPAPEAGAPTDVRPGRGGNGAGAESPIVSAADWLPGDRAPPGRSRRPGGPSADRGGVGAGGRGGRSPTCEPGAAWEGGAPDAPSPGRGPGRAGERATQIAGCGRRASRFPEPEPRCAATPGAGGGDRGREGGPAPRPRVPGLARPSERGAPAPGTLVRADLARALCTRPGTSPGGSRVSELELAGVGGCRARGLGRPRSASDLF